jgi:hypothetical protein
MTLLNYVQFRDLHLQSFNAVEPNGGWPARPAYSDLTDGGAYRIHGTERSPQDVHKEKRRWTLCAPNARALSDALGDLKNEIGFAGRLIGMTPDFLSLWTDAELLDVQTVGDARPLSGRMRGVGVPVETDFLLNTPSWYSETIERLYFSDIYDSSAESDMLLMDISGATPGTVVPMTWFIKGRARTGRITIRLTSGTGGGSGVTKLYLKNWTTGYTLQWDGTLPAGDELLITVNTKTITNDGADAYDELTLGAHTRWFELAPGINAVDVEIDDTATDDSTMLEVAYYPAYP